MLRVNVWTILEKEVDGAEKWKRTWIGSLGAFLDGNPDVGTEDIDTLLEYGWVYIGGGASPIFRLRITEVETAQVEG